MKLLNSALASTSGSSSTTWTYVGNETPNEFEFANDSIQDATLAISISGGVDYTFTVKAGEGFATRIPETFTEIVITISGNYRMLVGS